MPPQTFERTADASLDRVRKIYAERGGNYADTWALENQVATATRATLARFGIKPGTVITSNLTPEQVRLLQLAVLIDVKDSRLIGKWNPDSLDDGIAYRASYTTHRDEYEQAECCAPPYCCAEHSVP